MDPISQGAIGAVAPQVVSRRGKIRAVALLGCLAGLAPDLDVFISSSTDPLLLLEYHRQFTHALLFIPVGAALVALLLHPVVRRTLQPRETYLACLLGYATHGLLDACTSYGTQLFWPFSDYRVAWNNVSVIDPLFTLPLLSLVILAAVRQRRRFAVAGLVWALGYLTIGVVQHQRAEAAGRASGGGTGPSAAASVRQGRLCESAGLEGGLRTRRTPVRRRHQNRPGGDRLPRGRASRVSTYAATFRGSTPRASRHAMWSALAGSRRATSASTPAMATASSTCVTRRCPTPSTRCGESTWTRGPRRTVTSATSSTVQYAWISANPFGE